MKFEPQKMVNWYDVRQLAMTGVKTIVSSVFGNFADKREIQSVLSGHKSYDHSNPEKEIWIDFIADLGDGFNSTYTMAHLLASKQLKVTINGSETDLQRGEILVMGGDQVYPTPEKEEYRNRLEGPYYAAFPENKEDPHRPFLFALPGNHDWYDGLSNFLKLFCQNRSIGNWKTCQLRSYFAIKLPHDYWLWAIDVQLNADIDLPQQKYFQHVATNEMTGDSKIILCTAEPAWVYNSVNRNDMSYSRLSFFIGECVPKNVRVVTIITGDLHHYSRYEFTRAAGDRVSQMITAGGGGAFLHPTHILNDRLQNSDGTFELKKAFPDKRKSASLAFGNLAFPVFCWGMALFVGCYHLITSWFLQSATGTARGVTLMEKIQSIEFTGTGLIQYLRILQLSLFHNPAVVLLNTILFVGILKFTDTKAGKVERTFIAGFLHASLQVANFYLLFWIFSSLNLNILRFEVNEGKHILLFLVEIVVVGGLASGLLFGLYLLVCTLWCKSHVTEAFSSMCISGYKNFLKLRITKDELIIYPIGVEKVVKNWKNVGDVDKPKFVGDPIKYSLIEDPIHIK